MPKARIGGLLLASCWTVNEKYFATTLTMQLRILWHRDIVFGFLLPKNGEVVKIVL